MKAWDKTQLEQVEDRIIILENSIRQALNELGIADSSYPQNVANAINILYYQVRDKPLS